NEKRHLLNWLIHGIGIVCGLEVEDSNAEEPKRPKKVNGKWNVYLHAGVALDCYGREIVVSRDGFVEVEGTFNDEKLNYLYLRYNECEKESVPVLANVSTCEEVCRDNRVEEVFELELGDSPDEGKVSVSGKVTESDETTSIKGALIEALQNGVVKGITITNESGDYTLMLSPGTYDIRASASGYKSEDKTIPSVPSTNVNFHLPKETAPKDSRDIWVDMPQEYYKEHLKFCPRCEDAKVLLAVVDYNKSGDTETLEIKPEKTYEYRAIVYNNLMLYELISSHIVDFNNPHRMTAEQAGALVSVDGVKNPGGDVDLKPESGSAITITPDDAAKTITIGENHSGRTDNPHKVTAEQVRALKSVNNVGNVNKKYVENINLESEDDTIGITPKVSEDKIYLKLNEIAEKKIMFDTEVGHNHDGINSRLIECYESNLAHVKWINWEHNGDTPINE
ncbi:carboxypeptidase regulatory-like domain-containing protein, partial [candidate division WOR-3 bacterium]|nr:carboxypeptidase regulatory-like domain-containing protein [candidate division WOR-3 bacterium]